MTRIIAIETATEACSAALLLDGEVHERFAMAPQQHAQLILPMVEELLTEAGIGVAQLDAVALGRGPGSFTGVRIAAGVAQGIAFGADIPVVPVSTLATLAQTAVDAVHAERVLAAFDARMGQVYWGAYARASDGLVVLQGKETVCAPGDVPEVDEGPWWAAGSGWGSYADTLQQRFSEQLQGVEPEAMPHAAALARLALRGLAAGEAVAAEYAAPVYLRDNVAAKPRATR